MKKAYLCAVASLFLAAISCSDDDSTNPEGGIVNIDPDPTEEVALDANDVSAKIIIDDGTQISGNAPTPTGTLNFSMDQTIQSGFQKNGFDIRFDAPDNYEGAYIQLKSKDGALANEYWDVSTFNKSLTTNAKKRKRRFNQKANKLNDQEVEIDVDFENTVSAGTFCYLICIYDTDGNISQPVEVCVEIEAWGGNPNLVGIWNYTKQITNNQTIELGEVNFCEGPGTITCDNDNTLVVQESEGWCYASTEIKLTLNENGTFIFEDLFFQKQEFNFAESSESCMVNNSIVEDNFGSEGLISGMWAFDEEENTLSLIAFKDQTTDLETNFVDSYDEESGFLFYLSGTVTLNGTELIILSENEDTSAGALETFYSK